MYLKKTAAIATLCLLSSFAIAQQGKEEKEPTPQKTEEADKPQQKQSNDKAKKKRPPTTAELFDGLFADKPSGRRMVK